MASAPAQRATIEDLYGVEGKAELIGGSIVHFMSPGYAPSRVSLLIGMSLEEHTRKSRQGIAYGDGMIFRVKELPSGRESFVPDAAYHPGPPPSKKMRYADGPPALAVEVRSENDYGAAAEREMAEKRADYFAACALVVWDVDPEAEVIHVYRPDDPTTPVNYIRGQTAEAEPAVPGWRVEVDAIFNLARG